MFFTIDASRRFIEFYRLQTDGQWKRLEGGYQKHSDDMIFKQFIDADWWLGQNPKVIINDVEIETNPSIVKPFSETNYHFAVRTHRITAPKHLFTKEELKEVILTGDDTKTNCLVVDLDGYVKLVSPEANKTPLTLKGYGVRFETFGAYNNYVGPNTNLYDLDKLYVTLLDEWLTHLKTGKMSYTDIYASERSEINLISLIDAEVQEIVSLKDNVL